MAKDRLPMRKIRDILRSPIDGRLSPRQTALALKVSRGAVPRCLDRFRKSGQPYPLPDALGDMELEARLYPAGATSPLSRKPQRTKEDCAAIRRELSRIGVTLQLLWEDYRARNPRGLGYSWYCEQYGRYKKSLGLSFRNTYKGGEMSFLDYSGKERTEDVMETIEARDLCASAIVTTQLPKDKSYKAFADPTLADVIRHRLFRGAIDIPLRGESRRKAAPPKS